MAADEQQAAAASFRNLFFAAEQAHAACAPGQSRDTEEAIMAAESSLLHLRSLLSVTAATTPAGRHQADALLQQCVSRLHGLSVQHCTSESRRARVAELLKQAGCPEGFRFANPEGFDLGAKLRQSEPHKSLLSGPLPCRRVDLTAAPPAAPPIAPAPGVLAEQPANQQPPVPRRSGFQVPAAKSCQGRSHQPSVAASFGRQEQQQQQPQQGPPSGRQQPSAAAQSQGRQPPQDGRWSAKVPRRAHDAHVGHGRRGHTHGGGADDESSVESGEDEDYLGQEQGQGRSIPGFQTAKSKLISDLRQKGQQYNPSSGGGGGGGGAPPRPGLARPAGAGSRPAGLRKTGGAGGGLGASAGGKFVPPYLRKAIEAQNGGGGGEEAEGPLSQRTLEILRIGPGDALPEPLAKLDPLLIENVCSEVMDSGGQLDWNDIAGQRTAKDLIQEVVVWPIKNPQLFTGARAPPKGILLFGPPGTGKTMLGKAIATNISAVFFSISASSLVSKWMGEGEKLVRALFAVAAHVAPAVIFIDEVDSLLSARKADGEHESMRRLKTEILVQMEGIDPSRADQRVLLIGATNRPEELDEAARRRMPKQLYIPLPDGDARKDLILRQLGPGGPIKALLSDAELDKVVSRTAGYSGSDMKMLIQEACQGPVRDAFKADGAALAALTAEELRPVVVRDFQMASRAQKASVEPAEIQRYERYNTKHGAKLTSSEDGEEEEDDW
ncbi:hypothetical protein D9Q98_001250 [Chlorella vulgaris]|uniref:AAA+ ATPase domain-containing protein n=1 Tax=Chlorella vulgaris TaxID=3077 RepID=A0A9D4Z1Y5_CHLVU|nr:hypothetical protein D9Q98_001250 [Chlorella vulgaris]